MRHNLAPTRKSSPEPVAQDVNTQSKSVQGLGNRKCLCPASTILILDNLLTPTSLVTTIAGSAAHLPREGDVAHGVGAPDGAVVDADAVGEVDLFGPAVGPAVVGLAPAGEVAAALDGAVAAAVAKVAVAAAAGAPDELAVEDGDARVEADARHLEHLRLAAAGVLAEAGGGDGRDRVLVAVAVRVAALKVEDALEARLAALEVGPGAGSGEAEEEGEEGEESGGFHVVGVCRFLRGAEVVVVDGAGRISWVGWVWVDVEDVVFGRGWAKGGNL